MIIPLANAILDKEFKIENYYNKKKQNKKSAIFKNLIFQKVDKNRFPIIRLKEK